jgi:hypothetical protein
MSADFRGLIIKTKMHASHPNIDDATILIV